MQLWNEKRAILAGIGASACIALGGLVGMDAAGHVDAFYTTPPAPRYQAAAITPTPETGYDWSSSATYAVSPAVSANWDAPVGREEKAFFDTGVDDPPLDDIKPVRIHRAAVREEPVPPLPEPSAGDGAEDGWVDAPANIAEPERLPSG